MKALNGIGPGAGKGARERATEREMRRYRASLRPQVVRWTGTGRAPEHVLEQEWPRGWTPIRLF